MATGDGHLTERQKKWFAAVEATLERETGRTLAEWVAVARTCPETTSGRQRTWMREHHGLGINRAAYVLPSPSRRASAGTTPRACAPRCGPTPPRRRSSRR